METTLIHKAARYAVMAHDGQYRKARRGKGAPYVTHCFDVVANIRESAYPRTEVVLAAAFLHDVVEDTNISLEDIEYEFGEGVADVVDDLTLPPHIQGDYKAKRKHQIEVMRNTKLDDVRIIKIADKLDNIESLRTDPPSWGRKSVLGYVDDALAVIAAGIQHLPEVTSDPRGMAMQFLAGRAARQAELVRLRER